MINYILLNVLIFNICARECAYILVFIEYAKKTENNGLDEYTSANFKFVFFKIVLINKYLRCINLKGSKIEGVDLRDSNHNGIKNWEEENCR